jgi:hypothetical protein
MSDEWVTTKSELMAHIKRDWAALKTLLDRLTPEQFTQIKDANGWSVKDHVAHMSAWERSVIAFLMGKPRHEALGISEDVYLLDLLSGDVDVANGAIFQQTKNKPLEEIRSDFEAVHDELMKLVAPLDDAVLQLPYTHYLPDEPGEGDGQPAINVIYGNTAHHYREHREWIEALVNV